MTVDHSPDFDRDLTSSLESLAPQPALGLLDRAMAEVVATPQRRGWPAWSLAGEGAAWSRWLAFGAVAAVALVVGVLIGSSRGILIVGDQGSPPPAVSALPSSEVATASPFAGPTWTEPASYAYVVDGSQCGFGPSYDRFEVTVEDGRVVSYRSLDRPGSHPWPTSEMLTLAELVHQVQERARADGDAIVNITVDPDDGHPTRIDIDWLPNAIDDEQCYVIESYVVGSPSSSESPGLTSWVEPLAYRYVVADTKCGGGERNYIGTWELTVRNGKVASSRPIDETAQANQLTDDQLPTLRWIEERASEAPVVEIERDAADGHLTLVRMDWLPNAIDDEECYRISEYGVIGR